MRDKLHVGEELEKTRIWNGLEDMLNRNQEGPSSGGRIMA